MWLGDSMLLQIILFGLIFYTIYLMIEKIKRDRLLEKINKYIDEKNEKYYKDFLNDYEKRKKVKILQRINLIYKLNLMIEKAGIRRNVFVNPISIIVMGIVCAMLAYVMAFNFFKMITLAFIVAVPCVFIPILIVEGIGNYKSNKVEKTFLNFLIQLKNYARINNDVASAFKQVQTVEPLQSYINKFNLEISSGIKLDVAMEHLKEKISVEKFKEFFSNVQYCYIYGGDFSALIEKNCKIISELQVEKEKRKQETQGARAVLYILIFLNLFVYITYIKNNYENYLIMQRSFVGVGILYWNFISMWLLIFLAERVKKLDY